MPSFPPVQSVQRALLLLVELNKQRVTTIAELHRRTGLPKPTIVRLLETLRSEGFVSNDRGLGGYQVASRVSTLSSGFHGAPLIVEAARPWALDLTRRLKWPVSVALLETDAVVVRFNTIPESPISPFHATINMRLSLVARGLGRAYLAFCSKEERQLLVRMLMASQHDEDRPKNLPRVVEQLARTTRHRGYAQRDPNAEPKNSDTIAVPIMAHGRVLATYGLTYFRSAVTRSVLVGTLVPALKESRTRIEESLSAMNPA
jgi:IclR family mhp operon transcriptional activator